MPKDINKHKSISESVLHSAYHVMDKSTHVQISDTAIKKFTVMREPSQIHWLESYPWLNKIGDVDCLLDILFTFNSMSFCYWGEPKWSTSLAGNSMDGSELLLMCLREKVYSNKNFLKPQNLAKCEYDEFVHMLKGASNLKFVKERYSFFKLLGEIICDKYSGSYLEMIDATDGTMQGLLRQLIDDVPGFNDVSTYCDNNVYFYKRAQLLVSDINYCLIKGGFEGLSGIDTLTACADYKLPQMLRMFGILIYKESLAQKIDNSEEIEAESLEENEIRSATVVAVDRIAEAYSQSGKSITPMNVNDDLWTLSQSMSKRTLPYHKTLTIKY